MGVADAVRLMACIESSGNWKLKERLCREDNNTGDCREKADKAWAAGSRSAVVFAARSGACS
jgi:hypothetical protein